MEKKTSRKRMRKKKNKKFWGDCLTRKLVGPKKTHGQVSTKKRKRLHQFVCF